MAMTAHVVDLARMAIGDPAQPESVYCSGGRILYEDNREIPDIQAVTYQYDDFPMTCESAVFGNYMTKSSPEIRFGDKFPDWKLNSTRIEVYGTDRMMCLGIMGGGWQVLDEDGEVCDQEYGYFPDENHLRNFIECVRSRKKPNGDILQGHRSASLIHLANLAYRAGNKQLYVDRETETITNSARARELSKGYYRKPYQLPEVI